MQRRQFRFHGWSDLSDEERESDLKQRLQEPAMEIRLLVQSYEGMYTMSAISSSSIIYAKATDYCSTTFAFTSPARFQGFAFMC